MPCFRWCLVLFWFYFCGLSLFLAVTFVGDGLLLLLLSMVIIVLLPTLPILKQAFVVCSYVFCLVFAMVDDRFLECSFVGVAGGLTEGAFEEEGLVDGSIEEGKLALLDFTKAAF